GRAAVDPPGERAATGRVDADFDLIAGAAERRDAATAIGDGHEAARGRRAAHTPAGEPSVRRRDHERLGAKLGVGAAAGLHHRADLRPGAEAPGAGVDRDRVLAAEVHYVLVGLESLDPAESHVTPSA